MNTRSLAIIAVASIVVLSSIGLALTYLSGDKPEGSGSISVIDDRGKNVTFESHPQRIISLGSSFTEILFAIGAGERVIGVDYSSVYPEETANVTNLGKVSTLNMEAVISLDPDCVIMWNYSMYQSIMETMEGMNISVLAYYPRNVTDIMRVINSMGALTGNIEEASDLVSDMQARIDVVASKVGGLSEAQKPRVYFQLATMGGATAGPGTITNELITMAGGINIFGNASTAYPKPSWEQVVMEDPEVIVVEYQYNSSIGDITSQPGWDSIQAVQDGRVYYIDGRTVSTTPRVIIALEQLAGWLHPELFP